MAELAPTWFYGEGPDNALVFEWRAHLRWLRRNRGWIGFAGGSWDYVKSKRVEEWLLTVRSLLARNEGSPEGSPSVPAWIDERLVRETDLAERIREPGGREDSWHPRALASFGNPIWERFFTRCDPGSGLTTLDWRHPFLDLRVLKFLLSVPPIPFARRKLLLRQAMRGTLPEEVLNRRKTSLVEDPLAKTVRNHAALRTSLTGRIRDYVDPARVPETPDSDPQIYDAIRIQTLDYWLRHRPVQHRLAVSPSERLARETAGSPRGVS
jgi:asparagine synthase (glutamine-hydrolysing)